MEMKNHVLINFIGNRRLQAYERGIQAFMDNLSINDNYYTWLTLYPTLFSSWEKGYKEAEALSK